MKRKLLLLIVTMLVLALAACGGSAAESPAAAETVADAALAAPVVEQNAAVEPASDSAVAEAAAQVAAVAAAAEPVAALSAAYPSALPVESQLAFGTLQLESTDQAITADQATALLPLWQALVALRDSGTAADVELAAVASQIEANMTPAQLGIIAALQLTEDSLNELLASGALGMSLGGRGQGQGQSQGMGPGGGMGRAGGGLGQGMGGGPGGELGIEVSPEMMATRMAELEASGGSAVTQMGPAMVVRLLEAKTGQFEPGFGPFAAALAAASDATGLDADAIRAELAAGQTLRQIIAANGGDVAAARDAIIAALGDLPQAGEQDLAAWADELLDGQGAGGSAAPQN